MIPMVDIQSISKGVMTTPYSRTPNQQLPDEYVGGKRPMSYVFITTDNGHSMKWRKGWWRKNGEKERCFRKLSFLEKRKNELAIQETYSSNNTSLVDFLDSNSTSYNEGILLIYSYISKLLS